MIALVRKHSSQISFRKLSGPLCIAALVFYFMFHIFSGERGVYALFKESRRLEHAKVELTRLSAERAELEHRVQLMHSSSLDADLLDEQARSILNLSAPNEAVYFTPQQ